MPFGSFMAKQGASRPKREAPVKPQAPRVEKTAPAPVQQMPQAPQMVFREILSDSSKIHILLWGRTLAAMQEFLCSVSENMSRDLHREGLTYYTTENSTITDISQRKRQLERFFWEFSQRPWKAPEQQTPVKVYTFSISPSGNQDKTLDLIFYCCEYQAPAPGAQTDAVWYLADGPVLDEAVGYDGYREFIQEGISRAGQPEKPVCLLLSQIEHIGHFGNSGELVRLDPAVNGRLLTVCRSLFPGAQNHTAVIPVQVYGGLDYTGTDGNCQPVLKLAQSGFYQSYIPEACQVPCFYTVDQVAKLRGMDYFGDAPCGGMRKLIHRHFLRTQGEADWGPAVLQEVTRA